MKYQSRTVLLRFVQLALLAASVFCVPALAQFEVSPDHFDSTPAAATKKPADKAAAKKTPHAAGLSANGAGTSRTQVAGQGATVHGHGNASAIKKSAGVQQGSTAAKAAQAQPPAKSNKDSSAERVASARPQ
jgi:hypothetical protein